VQQQTDVPAATVAVAEAVALAAAAVAVRRASYERCNQQCQLQRQQQ